MAISTPAPTPQPDDLVDCDTAVRMLAESPHPISATTLRRLIRSNSNARTWTIPGLRGRPRVLVSLSTALDLHAAHYADADAAG